jgi:hypothetical protein
MNSLGTSTPSTAATTSASSIVDRPTATILIEVDDGSFGSVAEMAQASTLILIGDVIDLTSLGRPDIVEDPHADEYLAITVRANEVLKGQPTEKVVLGWDAFSVDADGQRVATSISNGLRPPDLGDRLLLFLVPADPAAAEHLGGAPTHQPVKLDGVAYLDGDRVTAGETSSPAADQLRAMSLEDIRDEVTA